MPISTDGTRLSIEFGYEYVTPSGDVLNYQMKFLHTAAGPSVQISNGPYEPVELPAQMFTEVAEFLIAQGVLRGAKPPVVGRSDSGGIGLPQISRRAGATIAATKPSPQEPVEAMSRDVEDPEEKEKTNAMAEARRRAQENASKKKDQRQIKSDHRPKDEE